MNNITSFSFRLRLTFLALFGENRDWLNKMVIS